MLINLINICKYYAKFFNLSNLNSYICKELTQMVNIYLLKVLKSLTNYVSTMMKHNITTIESFAEKENISNKRFINTMFDLFNKDYTFLNNFLFWDNLDFNYGIKYYYEEMKINQNVYY